MASWSSWAKKKKKGGTATGNKTRKQPAPSQSAKQITAGAGIKTGSASRSRSAPAPSQAAKRITAGAGIKTGSSKVRPVSLTTAAKRSAYRKRLDAHDAHMARIKKLEKLRKQTDDATQREAYRVKLRELHSDPKSKRPKQPRAMQAEKIVEAGEKVVSAVAKRAKRKARAYVAKPEVQAAMRRDRRERELGPKPIRKAERRIRRRYRDASPAEQERMVQRGLDPRPSVVGHATTKEQRRGSAPLRGTLISRMKKREERQAFRESRRKGRKDLEHAFPRYRKQVISEATEAHLKMKAQHEGRKPTAFERRQVTKNVRKHYLKRLRRSERWGERFGAVPEEGEKFWTRVREASELSKNKRTREVAQRVLQMRDEVESDLGTGVLKLGRDPKAMTPTEKVKRIGEEQRKRAREILEDRHVNPKNAGDVLQNLGDQIIGLKDAPVALGLAGLEVLKGGGHELKRAGEALTGKAGGRNRRSDAYKFERLEAMWDGFEEGDPWYGAVKKVLEGGSVEEAMREFRERGRRDPMGAILGASIVAYGAGKGAQAARFGTQARAVEAARPFRKIDDRGAKESFKAKGPVARVKETQRQRREARQQVIDERKRAKAAAKKQGGKVQEHFTPARPPKGQERQFYSRSTAVRGIQKGRETARALRGKEPFTVGNRHFRRRARFVFGGHKAATAAYGAVTMREVGKATKGAKFERKGTARQAAFELLYDGTLRPGSIADDLKAARAAFAKADGDVAKHNVAMLDRLADDLAKRGDKGLLGAKMQRRVAQLQKEGHALDEALVRAGVLTKEQAAMRRDLAGAIGRGEVRRVAEGEVLGEVTEATASQFGLRFKQAEKAERQARERLANARQKKASQEVIEEIEGQVLEAGRRRKYEEKLYAGEKGKAVQAEQVKAARDGWVWTDPSRWADGDPYFKPGKGDGAAFVDYTQVTRGRPRPGVSGELAPESVGRLRSAEPVVGRKLGDEHVRASMESRANLLGRVRLRQQLLGITPHRGAMPQAEAQNLLMRLNRPGEPRYVAVPVGKAGRLEPGDGFDPVKDLTRRAGKDEPVAVVPEAVVKVFEQMERPPGAILGSAQYLQQRFVSAVLPFSVNWHAGNAIDLVTRLAVSGVNPFRDRQLSLALRRAMEGKGGRYDADVVFAQLRAHMGQQSQWSRGARFERAWAGARSSMQQELARHASELADRKAVRGTVGAPWRASERAFDMASAYEGYMVQQASGRVARQLARDLGIQVRDHMRLAERLVREIDADPALIEEFGRRTLEIVGDYATSSLAGVIAKSIDPFWTWMREANKFVFVTTPSKHPLKMGMAAVATQLSMEASERLGLDHPELDEVGQFLFNAFPVTSKLGWYRPTAPFTSWGEALRMAEDPISYLADRPFPWAQRAGAAARGYKFYDGLGRQALGRFERSSGVKLPGFKAPSLEKIGHYKGNKIQGVTGSLLGSFVPGISPYERARVSGFPGPESNLFNPGALPGTEVPWYENEAINPFGRRRNLDSISASSSKSEDSTEEKPKVEPRVGQVLYNRNGEPIRWNGKRWQPARVPDAKPKVRTTGKAKDAPKPKAAQVKKAVAKISRELGIPEEFARAIATGSRKYDVPPEVLASIAQIETNFAQLEAAGVLSGENFAGAGGPMQFLQGTWDAYGVDADGDGKADRYSITDAVHSAANYLVASGWHEDPRKAIYAYNHAEWYVNDVLEGAERFQSRHWREAGTGAKVAIETKRPKGPRAEVYRKLVTGKREGLVPELRAGLVKLARIVGHPIELRSGRRSRAEQAALYQAYLNGTGNLAAPPGSSNHESGAAADIVYEGIPDSAFAKAGLHRPVPGEPWHVEPIEDVRGYHGGAPSAGGGNVSGVMQTPGGTVPGTYGATATVDREEAGRRRLRESGLALARIELAMALARGEIDPDEYVKKLGGLW